MPIVLRTALAVLAIAASGLTVSAQSPEQKPAAPSAGLASATFASGCFWCTESDFDKVPGVVETISGYTGGTTKSPTYELVGAGGTGHAEALLVKYDPAKVSYQALLDHYWHTVDLLDGGGQFCDRGDQYRPVIFTHDAEQQRLAEAGKSALEKSGRFDKPIAVKIEAASTFTPAEDYHQNYHNTNSLKYRYYRYSCGRDARLKELWGKEAGH